MAEEAKYNHQIIEKKSDKPCDHVVATCKVEEYAAPPHVEATERRLFDFMGKVKEEKYGEEVIGPQSEEKVQVSEPECKKEEKEEEKKREGQKPYLFSSSSSDEEIVEEGEKKKKKGLKENISGDTKEEEKIEKYENSSIAVEKCDEILVHEESEEKKGFQDKIEEKQPGGQTKTEESPPASIDGGAKEKKGVWGKIKEKLPWYHSITITENEKEKDKEKKSAFHQGQTGNGCFGEAKEKKGFLKKIKEKLPWYHSKTENEKEEDKEKKSAFHQGKTGNGCAVLRLATSFVDLILSCECDN